MKFGNLLAISLFYLLAGVDKSYAWLENYGNEIPLLDFIVKSPLNPIAAPFPKRMVGDGKPLGLAFEAYAEVNGKIRRFISAESSDDLAGYVVENNSKDHDWNIESRLYVEEIDFSREDLRAISDRINSEPLDKIYLIQMETRIGRPEYNHYYYIGRLATPRNIVVDGATFLAPTYRALVYDFEGSFSPRISSRKMLDPEFLLNDIAKFNSFSVRDVGEVENIFYVFSPDSAEFPALSSALEKEQDSRDTAFISADSVRARNIEALRSAATYQIVREICREIGKTMGPLSRASPAFRWGMDDGECKVRTFTGAGADYVVIDLTIGSCDASSCRVSALPRCRYRGLIMAEDCTSFNDAPKIMGRGMVDENGEFTSIQFDLPWER